MGFDAFEVYRRRRSMMTAGDLSSGAPPEYWSSTGGGQWRTGLAALGGAAALPAMVLAYMGAVGVTTLLGALAREEGGPPRRAVRIGGGAAARKERGTRPLPAGVAKAPPFRRTGLDDDTLKAALLDMDPFAFECHVMGFFARDGLEAWVTGKTNDNGIDGFVRHPRGLVVVQCKRNATGNMVGRPTVQQLRGVVAEHDAVRGYLVTTSRFSDKARHSARMSDQVELVDMRDLLRWHREPPRFCF